MQLLGIASRAGLISTGWDLNTSSCQGSSGLLVFIIIECNIQQQEREPWNMGRASLRQPRSIVTKDLCFPVGFGKISVKMQLRI